MLYHGVRLVNLTPCAILPAQLPLPFQDSLQMGDQSSLATAMKLAKDAVYEADHMPDWLQLVKDSQAEWMMELKRGGGVWKGSFKVSHSRGLVKPEPNCTNFHFVDDTVNSMVPSALASHPALLSATRIQTLRRHTKAVVVANATLLSCDDAVFKLKIVVIFHVS